MRPAVNRTVVLPAGEALGLGSRDKDAVAHDGRRRVVTLLPEREAEDVHGALFR